MKDFIPRAFQIDAKAHLLDNERCALHIGCGMGKTSTTVDAIDTLILAGETRRTLVVGPLRVARSTWSNEVNKWNQFKHLRVSTIVGDEPTRLAALKVDADIYTINYENLPWLVKVLGRKWFFDTVVADESTKLKGHRLRQGGQRTRALSSVSWRPASEKPKVRRFIELTGLPAPNGLIDLWGQLFFLDKGSRLGTSYTAFVDRWFSLGYNGHTLKPMPHAMDEIPGLISDLCLPMRASDYFDLPPRIENPVDVELPPKARMLYDEMEKEMYVVLGVREVEAFSRADATGKCLQLAAGAAYTDKQGTWHEVHTVKLDALESIIEEANGKPIIVAYHFKSDLARILKRFPQARVLDTAQDEDDFKAGKIPVLLCHPDSAGHGIDGFQYVTNEIVFFTSWWNLETREQLIERIGETRQAQAGTGLPVVIHNIVAKGTLDEVVLERVKTKADVDDLLYKRMQERRGKWQTK